MHGKGGEGRGQGSGAWYKREGKKGGDMVGREEREKAGLCLCYRRAGKGGRREAVHALPTAEIVAQIGEGAALRVTRAEGRYVIERDRYICLLTARNPEKSVMYCRQVRTMKPYARNIIEMSNAA